MNTLEKPAVAPMGQRIAETAAALFADRGYDSVSMREIADAVGIKAASLYNHYDDKEALYRASLEQALAERMARVNDATTSEGTTQERLLQTLNALTFDDTQDAVTVKLLQRELVSGDKDRHGWLTDHLFRRPFEEMTELFEEIARPGQGQVIALHLCALTIGYSVLAPIFEQLDVPAYLTDPEELAQDIAARLSTPTNEEER
jgi:AcrR family transcriptional regulator